MLVSLAITGFLLIVMPGLLYLVAYLAKRYTTDRPIRLKPKTSKTGQGRGRPLYGEFVPKPGKPVYVERA
jgi:hypothetical protein